MIWSVSLIFYHPSTGYLIGQELRKKEKDILFQPVGGKVEVFDRDPLDTGVREFIEETTLGLNPFFCDIAESNFKKWTQENTIDLKTVYPKPSTWIQNELYQFCSISNIYYDYQLLNSHKVHRFYIIDLSKIKNDLYQNPSKYSNENKELFLGIHHEIMNLPFSYNMLEPHFRIHDKMWSLYWITYESLKYVPKPSNLINVLSDKLKNDIKKSNNLRNNYNKDNRNKSLFPKNHYQQNNLQTQDTQIMNDSSVSNNIEHEQEQEQEKSNNETTNNLSFLLKNNLKVNENVSNSTENMNMEIIHVH